MSFTLQIGNRAPDLRLSATDEKIYALSGFSLRRLRVRQPTSTGEADLV
jgi:hypothetical protein